MATKPGFIFCRIVKELPKIDYLIFFSFFCFLLLGCWSFSFSCMHFESKSCWWFVKFAGGQFSPLICRTMPRSRALLCIARTCTHCCLAISHGRILRKRNGCSGSVAWLSQLMSLQGGWLTLLVCGHGFTRVPACQTLVVLNHHACHCAQHIFPHLSLLYASKCFCQHTWLQSVRPVMVDNWFFE